MTRFRRFVVWLLACAMLAPGGCQWQRKKSFEACIPPGAYEQVATAIEYPAETTTTACHADESLAAPEPWTISTEGTPEYWNLSLEEAIQLALANSRVLRDLGGAVVRAPDATQTATDPAIVETDPRFGVEAALSEFDAQLLTSVFWEKNDRAFNNEFFGGGSTIVQQDVGVFQAAITKRAATGSRFTIRHNVDYDANNAEGNLFDSAWNTNVEMEIRHPLLQGGGVQFNRIAGPNSPTGVYNGVMIARLNTDVALNDFEIAVRDLVSNVESAYWDLYYGYRVLDARVQARDTALITWRKIYALFEADRRGGEAEKEAQAREQFFRFQEDVQNAMSGEPLQQTRNWNGLPSGTFNTTGGVLMSERRLRLLMGLPPTDGRLIRPRDEPVLAKINFDWFQVTEDATTRRAELRRQKWQIRRRELELIASKNHLLPRLDAVGRYRWRGFGDDLFPLGEPPMPPDERFDGAYSNLTSGDFQEWQLGFELSMPIGFRLAHVATRNAELQLARERAILRDQQREVVHEAADAIAELDRAYVVLQSSYNRLVASEDQAESVEAAYESDRAPLDLVLDAHRRRADAMIDYTLSRTRYALAIKNVHFVKGTLLDYDGVYLAEGPWPTDAYRDAAKLEARRSKARPLNYISSRAPMVSRGIVDQWLGESSHGELVLPQPVKEELPLELRGTKPSSTQPVPPPAPTPSPAPQTNIGAPPTPVRSKEQAAAPAATDTHPIARAEYTPPAAETAPTRFTMYQVLQDQPASEVSVRAVYTSAEAAAADAKIESPKSSVVLRLPPAK